MTIRTPNPVNTSQMLLDLQRSKNRLNEYSSQITTGQRIVNLGDDPSGSAMILNFQTSIDQNKQYMAQIDTATAYLQNTEDVATTVGNQVTRLMQLAQTGISSTQSDTSRQAIASEVDGIFKNLVNLGNTKVQGKYLFGGSQTMAAPFDASTAPAGSPNSITYNGNNSTINFDVGASATTPTNVPGDTLFLGGNAATPGVYGGSLDLFNATKSLSLALQPPSNTANMQAAYTNLKAISDHINNVVTSLGGLQNGITSIKTSLSDLNANMTSVQNSVQAVDYPTAITGFTQENVAQQATLQTMAKLNKVNLFDYLA
jgi:flagellar hook-associated protein 3 FlgL